MARITGIAVPFRFNDTGYPAPNTDTDLLSDSILTILKTVPGSRPYRPTFGCYVSRLLFSNMSVATSLRARAEARRAISTWEPRVIVDDILLTNSVSKIVLTIIWRPTGNLSQKSSTSFEVVT